MRKMGLEAVADGQTEILILGTLPSDRSLSKRQYYANPENDFWKLMGAVLYENLKEVGYDRKIEILRAHRIGLWDVSHACVRPGSMDKDITRREHNDFSLLKTITPALRLVCFNGKEPAKSAPLLLELGYETEVLPSSSPANRRESPEREHRWKAIIGSRAAGVSKYPDPT